MSNGDEPAYPRWDLKQEEQRPGLTKRELFAAMAMQGLCLLGDGSYSLGPCNAAMVERSVVLADALLAELEKEPDDE